MIFADTVCVFRLVRVIFYTSNFRAARETHIIKPYRNKIPKLLDIPGLGEREKLLIQNGCDMVIARREIIWKIDDIIPRIFRVISGSGRPFFIPLQPHFRGDDRD